MTAYLKRIIFQIVRWQITRLPVTIGNCKKDFGNPDKLLKQGGALCSQDADD